MDEFILNPAQIEARSMQIIGDELRQRGIVLPEENMPVIRRVIHATADFDYAENLVFSEGAARAGVLALRKGTPVITDTNMARSGINSRGLGKTGSRVLCFAADEDVAENAKAKGITRAACAVLKAAESYPDAVYAFGNAPTALLSLISLIEEGLRPALVIAAPVGFVNVVEAKELMIKVCLESGIPVIAARGRKGGSTVAAAICNALVYAAAGLEDPHKRM